MTLIIEDFNNWYNSTNSQPFTGDTADVEFLLSMYQEEISSIINLERSNFTKSYTFDACSQFYLAVPIWKNYTVTMLDKGSNSGLTLEENKDYIVQKSQIEDDKIIGLDFSCLRCNCKCEIVRINGIFGYKLSDYIVKIIFRLISQITSNDCCDDTLANKTIEKITVGNVTKTYSINDDEVKTQRKLKNGYGITEYEPVKNWIRKVKLESIIL